MHHPKMCIENNILKWKHLQLIFASDQDQMKRIKFTFLSIADKSHTEYMNNPL